jgi:hypothetical protein
MSLSYCGFRQNVCLRSHTLDLRALKNIHPVKFGGRYLTVPPLDVETLQVVKFGCLKCLERDFHIRLNSNVRSCVTVRLKYMICMLLCMGVKLGRSN